jgi:ABC-type spermidine/putrescine transport system permease subunit I
MKNTLTSRRLGFYLLFISLFYGLTSNFSFAIYSNFINPSLKDNEKNFDQLFQSWKNGLGVANILFGALLIWACVILAYHFSHNKSNQNKAIN